MRTFLDNVTRRKLDNGLTVLVKESHVSPIVAIFTYVKVGYFNEPDHLVGISHLMEHMYFKGTEKRGVGEIALETKALGGYLNASTIYDHTLYYTVLPNDRLAHGLDIQSDALLNPKFDPGELKKETEVVIEEVKRKWDMPSAVAREKLFELAFVKHRMQRWRIGTEQGLRALTREDFLRFHRDLYRPDNVILVIVGDIETAEALQQVEKYYGHFEKGDLKKETSPEEPPQNEFRYRLLTGEIQQSYLAMGFHTPDVMHPDTYALEMLGIILGHGRSSRLVQHVKEDKSLVNSISSYNYAMQDVGIFQINALASPDKLRAAEAAIMDEFTALHQHPVEQQELERARAVLEAIFGFSMESVSGQANLLASYEALGDYRLVEDYLAGLWAVKVDDIRRVVAKYLTLNNCSLLEYIPVKAGLDELDRAQFESDHARRLRSEAPSKSATKANQSDPITLLTDVTGTSGRMKRHVLANGITLLIKEDHQVPVVAAGVFARGGRNRERAHEAGLTRLSIRNALKGTSNRTSSEIARAIENLGSSIQGSYEPDYCGFTMNILSKHFEKGWDILADVIANPTFPQEELTKEKETTRAAIAQTRDDMLRFPIQRYYATLFHDHPYGWPVHGNEETLSSLTRENLAEWHARHFIPENMTVIVVGDVNTDQLKNLVENGFGQLQAHPPLPETPPPVPAPEQILEVTETSQKEQSALVLGFPGPAYVDPAYYPLTVLQNVLSGLGGRFFEELRGRQSLAYTVATYLVSRRYGGSFLAYLATSPEKEQTARAALLNEFASLLKERLTEGELAPALRYTVGTYKIGLETYRSQMAQYAHNELLDKGFEETDRVIGKFERVTVEDIFAVIHQYVDLKRYAVAIVHGQSKARQ